MRAGSPPPYVGPPPVPKMPAGLVDLVEGLTREVLRNNPKNVHEFCAKHLEKLLESRDGALFKKPMLTLEQKIHNAQEKLRQKAKERREKYDREINARSLNTEPTTEFQEITENNTLKSESDVSISNAMPPVHHEEGLKPDSEVEIAHKPSYTADEEKTYKVENVDSQKEKTLPGLTLTICDSNTDTMQGKDISNEALVNAETTLPIQAEDDKAIENMNTNDTKINILSVTDTEALSPTKLQDQDIASDENKDYASMHREEQLTNETKSVTITQSLIKENTVKSDNSKNDEKNNSQSSTETSDIKVDSNNTTNLNKKASNKNSAESQRESDLLTSTEDKNKSNKNEASLTKNNPDDNQAKNVENVKKEENNERVTKTNVQTTKEVDSLSENCDELSNTNIIEQEPSIGNLTIPNEIISVIEDTSNIHRNTNNETNSTPNINNAVVASEPVVDLSSIKDSTNNETNITLNGTHALVASEPVVDLNIITNSTNNETNGTPIGKDAVVVPEPAITRKNMTTVDKAIDDTFEKTAKVVEEIPKSTDKDGTEATSTKPQITMTLNANYTENKKENIKEMANKETLIQEKENKVNDSPSIQVSENIEIISDHISSLVESDLSKIDEDTAGENQNEQNNMDLETAAVTIQKVFRTFLFKSRNSTFDDGANDEGTSLDDDSDNIKKEEYYAAANLNKDRRHLGISRMDTVLQTVNEEKSLSLSTDDSSTLSSAATTIQAHVRGFLVRNRLNSNKTVSTNSVNSNELLEPDTELQKNKTVLNIHIVPEEGNYLSRDESIITSMELSLDGSPPSSVNLHPLSYDVSERRKLLKREDAIQSISPPSNNSDKLSEESVKELNINDELVESNIEFETDKSPEELVEPNNDSGVDSEAVSISSTATATTIINVTDLTKSPLHERSKSLHNMDHDESDVVTPYVPSPRSESSDYENSSKLVHSGEFHDALLPTRVTRNDPSVVREFKNVLVYFIIWNH